MKICWDNSAKRPEVRKKISDSHKKLIVKTGKDSHNWKGGACNFAYYDTYANKIEYAEKIRRNKNNFIETKCTYCGKWYIPTMQEVVRRIRSLNGYITGENRIYCSNECKHECPIFNQKLWPKGFKLNTSREIQPELRQMVLERDSYQCIKCSSKESLHCHHLEGIRWEPLESADVDMCITLCKSCHKAVHELPDCGYHDMRCEL